MKRCSLLAALTLWSGCLFSGHAQAERIIVIGDSWAEPIGRQLRVVVMNSGRPDIEVVTTPYWGGPRNLDTPEGRQAISGWLELWPDATTIYMQMGQNNWLCCWNTGMIGSQEEAELFDSIIEHMDNVVAHILSRRPDITLWWTAGEYFRPHHLGTPAELNTNHDRLAYLAGELAQSRPELNFLHWNGMFQVHYGFDGVGHTIYDPMHAIPPGDSSLPDPSLPSPYEAFPANRPAHPRPAAYRVMAEAVFDAITGSQPPGEIFEIDAGLNGNWWNGPDRNGEGVQIEVSDGGSGSQVFVATIYSYAPTGGQIFLVAVGAVEGDTVDANVFITDGGTWGSGFDPASVSESLWGTGSFRARSCGEIDMLLSPNSEHQALGYTDLEYGLVRLTTALLPCPASQSN
ncbi:MAG: hypothetical protein R3212_07330 [Xanthomonadales bacterium]|nr:hypothetical protein [Xanthomonadales bacterium]